MQGKIAKWWMPDDVVFVTEIPHTATGKIQKTALRERFKDYPLPTAAPYLKRSAGSRAKADGRLCNIVASILEARHSASKTRVNALMARTSG